MAVRASVDRGADGRWVFEGDTSRVPGDGGVGGGGGAGGIQDMRYSLATKSIEVTYNNTDWVPKVFFEEWDA